MLASNPPIPRPPNRGSETPAVPRISSADTVPPFTTRIATQCALPRVQALRFSDSLRDGHRSSAPCPSSFRNLPMTSTMSQTSANYQAIFDSALEVYKRKTGKDLTSHPLLGSFETCNSLDAVLAVLKAQILGPGQPQSSGDKLLAWLNPTITVLNAFSATVGGGVNLVSLYEV